MYRRSVCLLSRGVCLGSLLWASLAVTPAGAGTVTYNFAGTVADVPAALTSQFNTDQSMWGSVTVSDTGSGPSYSTTAFTLHIGTYLATKNGVGSVTIQNNNTVLNAPTTIDRMSSTQFVSGGSVGSYTPNFFAIDLRGPETVFSSQALPSTPPSISSFSILNSWRLVFKLGTTSTTVSGQLTAVPLPAAVLLFGAGLVALVGLGAGSRSLRASRLVS